MSDDSLFAAALQAAEKSYSPYSHFRVGAALLCSDGKVFVGTNVENRSFGLTICAERSAIVSAVSAGERDFSALAIATPDAQEPVGPCGACRQVISEFLSPDSAIEFGTDSGKRIRLKMSELLPWDSLQNLKDRPCG
ncbi:MAG TPA: cytidine deaminase [Rectinemataceae bacterium]